MVIAAALLAAALSCPIERASYALRGTPQVTAHFERVPRNRDWWSGLVLVLHGDATGRTTYWLPWSGGTDGQQHIRSTALHDSTKDREAERQVEMRGDLDFFTLDRDYCFDAEQPRAGRDAPAHLLIPDLDLWHADEVNGRRDASPRAFFDLTGCGRSTAQDRGPDVILPIVP